MRQRIVINDVGLPNTQRSLLGYQLGGLASAELEVYWLSQLRLNGPSRWDVQKPVASALWGRFWAIVEGQDLDRVLYLNGNCLVRGDLRPLLEASPPEAALSSSPGGVHRLVELDWFVANRRAPQWESLAVALREAADDYDSLADFPIEASPNSDGSREKSALTGELPIAILLPLHERPWYRAQAPAAAEWTAQLFEALEAEAISTSVVSQEAIQGLVRPSLRFQVENRLVNPLELPPAVLDVDLDFSPPDMTPDSAQRAFLLSKRTAARNRFRFAIGRFRKNPRAVLVSYRRSLQKKVIRTRRKIRFPLRAALLRAGRARRWTLKRVTLALSRVHRRVLRLTKVVAKWVSGGVR